MFVIVEVRGRHAGHYVFRPENIQTEVTSMGDLRTIRLDDSSVPEFWIEIDLLMPPKPLPCIVT